MFNFKQIEYRKSLKLFDKAERIGQRLKIGEFDTSKWLQQKNVKLDEVVDFSKQLPDARIFIIGTGTDEGFYIYSKKQEVCFKFEQHRLAAV